MIQIGDKLPEFNVANQDGLTVTNEALLGKKTVLYFYPKDSTPGCTAEACNLRDNLRRLQSAGYQVIGVSRDSERSHQNFRRTYDLPFPLLSDPDTSFIRACDAWGEKNHYGKISEGPLRRTLIINEEGVVTRIIDKVDTKRHTQQILEEE